MLKNIIDDGFNPKLVTSAFFDGIFEIPRMERPKEFIIPNGLVPFTHRNQSENFRDFVCFYEHDFRFGELIYSVKDYVTDLSRFPGVISPDCSLYRDMPLCLQTANTYMNRAIGHFLQSKGLYVIPNVRWGDERSFSTEVFLEKFAFLGLPKNSIVSIGTYGCIKSSENKSYFKEGLEAMLNEISPEVVLVYGGMPDCIFSPYKSRTQFVHYPDWTSTKRRRAV